MAAHTIVIRDFAFDPPTLEIRQGDTIKWRNEGTMVHSATRHGDPLFDTGDIQPGSESESIRFDFVPETLEYICRPHTFMKGKIRITALPPSNSK